MSKEAPEDLQLWYRPRTEPSGTMNVPPDKFSNHNDIQGLLSIPPEPSNSGQCELQDLLIVTSEGTTSVDSSESSKKKPQKGSKSSESNKKRSHKKKDSKALNTSDPSSASKTFEPIVIVDDSDGPKGKKISSVKKTAGTNSAEKLGKQVDAKVNGKAMKETVKKIVENAKSSENSTKSLPAPTPKPSEPIAPSIEALSRPAESLLKSPELPSKSALKPKKVPKTPGSPIPAYSSEGKNVKSESSGLIFQCPNTTCSQSFANSEDFIGHIKNSHSLSCKMPFCTYSTYTFQEYCEHFEHIHCLSPSLPQKRGPRASLQEADGMKEAKNN